jgi:hypothetical protein
MIDGLENERKDCLLVLLKLIYQISKFKIKYSYWARLDRENRLKLETVLQYCP